MPKNTEADSRSPKLTDLPDGVEIRGTNRGETLTGSGGDDILDGRKGDDRLHGAGGNDTLTGGPDDDTFVFTHLGKAGHDTVTDLGEGDSLVFYRRDVDSVLNVHDHAHGEGGDTVIDGFHADQSVRLVGVNEDRLSDYDINLI